MKRCKTWCLAVLLISVQAMGQNHFWAQQFGANASLTGGAGIAGVRDNSALFYNPGVMGFIENPKISISANLYGIDVINLKNVAGTNINGQSVRTNVYPQFAGGCFFIPKVPKLKIFYGILTRSHSSVRYNVVHEMHYDVIKGAPGDEYYKARLDYDFSSTETWAGIGVGYKINDMFSVGASMFGSYINIENSSAISINADAVKLDSLSGVRTPYTATSNQAANVRIDHISLIWKVGVGIDLKKWKLGFAFTLPSAHIWGQGSLFKSIEGYNLNTYSPDTTNVFAHPSFLISDEQKKLTALYKTVPSFALGATYLFKKIKVDLSVEYFLSSGLYDVLRGVDKAYIRPAEAYGGQPLVNFMVVRTRSAPVFNVGLGGTFKIKDRYKILTGFRTDFNNRMNFLPNVTGLSLSSLAPSYWHMMHFSLGASYNRGANDVTVGVNYAFAIAADRTQVVNFSDPEQDRWLRGKQSKTVKTDLTSIELVIGYTYFFRGSPRSSEPAAKRLVDW